MAYESGPVLIALAATDETKIWTHGKWTSEIGCTWDPYMFDEVLGVRINDSKATFYTVSNGGVDRREEGTWTLPDLGETVTPCLFLRGAGLYPIHTRRICVSDLALT